MEKINIVHIISGGGIGGGEKFLQIFAKYSDKEKIALHFVVPEKGVLYEKLSFFGYKPKVIDINKSLFSFETFLRLKRYLIRSKTDIVHTHGARANYYGRIAAYFAKVPVIISTIHNSINDYPINALKKKFYIYIDRLTSSFVSEIVSVSNYIKESLVNDYKIAEEKITTIYPAVDFQSLLPDITTSAMKKKLSIPESSLVIGQIGRMTNQKGFEYSILSAKKIISQFNNVYFLFVGDGELKKRLEEKCISLGIKEKCIFTGFVDNVGNVYQIIDILLMPSLSEGFPVTLIEAAFFEKPEIAAKVSGIPEFIKDGVNGILIPPADSRALEAAIEKLIRNKDMRIRLGKEAKNRVSELFSPAHMLKKYLNIYEKHIEKDF
ncbi:MAG: glycosyltransferase family 1 protein [Candidatus Schekmanbacteria bacterium]|nr:MAG: glycosyltransferase family 1 protein [Candidatus Schekmanbacteria bacterium]